jgi:hypothetical protein
VAAGFAERWLAWCKVVGETKMPRDFGRNAPETKLREIPWSDIADLRKETGLTDEKITRELADLLSRAQGVLSAELTGVLCKVQQDAFADAEPYEGWPYTDPNGSDTTGLQTVPFENFTTFLATVKRAEDALNPLLKGLPDDVPLVRSRRAFLGQCREWSVFLPLDAQGLQTELVVTVWTEDPFKDPLGKERVDDTAQAFYRNVQLVLGLRVGTGAAAIVKPLEFATTAEMRGQANKVDAVWDWKGVSEPELTFALVDGIPPVGKTLQYQYPTLAPRAVGRSSHLALCAYLHRYGNLKDGNWYVTHGIDLPDALRKAKRSDLASQLPPGIKTIGEKFVFDLKRRLPGPIPKLLPAERETAGKQ